MIRNVVAFPLPHGWPHLANETAELLSRRTFQGCGQMDTTNAGFVPPRDNPSCVRPDHLFIGTHTDNMRDMWAKGRGRCDGAGRKGSANGNHKLTEEQVGAIRQRLSAGQSQRSLGQEYGVSKTLIGLISKGRAWKNIQEIQP